MKRSWQVLVPGLVLLAAALALAARPAAASRVTATRMEIHAAAHRAGKIPGSVSAWARGHVDALRAGARGRGGIGVGGAARGEYLSDDERFTERSLLRYEQLVGEVFGEASLAQLAEERHLALLEVQRTQGDEQAHHHVTHSLDELVDVLDDAHAVHETLRGHHAALTEAHAHIREHHPEHHGVVPASLFELVEVNTAITGLAETFSSAKSTKGKGVLSSLRNIFKHFVRALEWLWAKLKMALRVLARIVLHIVGNTYVGLGLDASVLPVPGAGPLFQLCFDASGLLFGSTSARDIVLQEFDRHKVEKSALADADLAEMNGGQSASAAAAIASKGEGHSLFLELERKFKSAGMRNKHMRTLLSITGNDDDEIEGDIPAAEYKSADQSGDIEAQAPGGGLVVATASDEVAATAKARLAKDEGVLLSAGDEVVPDSEVPANAKDGSGSAPRTSLTDEDAPQEPKGKKKSHVKEILLTLKAMFLKGLKSTFTASTKMHAMQKELQDAQGVKGDIEDGAVRACLNMPFVGMFPSVPRLTMGLSIAMIKGFAVGVKTELEPYLKQKSAALHNDNLVKSLAKGHLGAAKKIVAQKMFYWQNMRISSSKYFQNKLEQMHTATVSFLLRQNEKRKRKEGTMSASLFGSEEALTAAEIEKLAAVKFHPSVFQNIASRQTFMAAKDRRGMNDPEYAKKLWKEQAPLSPPAPEDKKLLFKLSSIWFRMTLEEKKPWFEGAENQLKAVAAHWAWALPETTAGSVVQSTSTTFNFMDSFTSFVKHQLPFLIAKTLSDQMGSLANTLASVLGQQEDDAPPPPKVATENALVEVDEKEAAAAARTSGVFGSKATKVSGVVRYPHANEKLYLGDTAQLVFDMETVWRKAKSSVCQEDKLVVELRADGTYGSTLHGRWEMDAVDLKGATVPKEGLRAPPGSNDGDGDGMIERTILCGSSMHDKCKVLRIKLEKPAPKNNPDNKDMKAGKGYFFRLACGKDMVTKGEPRFTIMDTVRPERSPCRETLMLTFGLFPFKYPVGVDANLIKCGSSAMAKMKNKISAMKRKKKEAEEEASLEEGEEKEDAKREGAGRGDSADSVVSANGAAEDAADATAKDASGRQIERDLESGAGEEETDEEFEAANKLETAQGNSEYGLTTASKTARSSKSCSRLRVYGGIGIDLGALDLLLTGMNAWWKAIKAGISLVGAHLKKREDNIETAWLPSKRELELQIVESGFVDTLEDPLLAKLFEPLVDITDPEQKLTREQLSTLKSTDRLLTLIIQEKQEEVLQSAHKKRAASGAIELGKAFKETVFTGLKYYAMLTAAETLENTLAGKGLGLEVHASFGPLGSAFRCMGDMVVQFGKKLVKRMRKKGLCKRECSVLGSESGSELASEGVSVLAEMESSDYEQCGHAALTFDAVTRPTLPTCQLSPKSMFSSQRDAYCMQCKAVGDECGINSDCTTSLCHDKTCQPTNLVPGKSCTRNEMCASGVCQGGVCTVVTPDRCEEKAQREWNLVGGDEGAGGGDVDMGAMGGCRCKEDNDCKGGGTCRGFAAHFYGNTLGVCLGAPPAPLCARWGVRSHCCSNTECTWNPDTEAEPGDEHNGKCVRAKAPWPVRHVCDHHHQYDADDHHHRRRGQIKSALLQANM